MADQKADVRHIQEMLRAAGYDVNVDGNDGPQTQNALRQYKASQNAVDAKKADAAAAEANAKAEEAKANAERTRAETEKTRLDADTKKRADDAAAETSKRIFDTSITATSYAAGVAVGTKTAKTIDAKVAEGLANKNKELKKVAKELTPLIGKVDAAAGAKKSANLVQRTLTKIDALVTTADKIGLTKVARGPAGPVAAVGMLAIGAVSRTAASQTDNETIKTVLNASGTAEMVAGAVVGVKDLANRAAPTKTVDAKALGLVEQGRAMVREAGIAAEVATKAPSLASRVLSVAGKVGGKIALPVAAVVATVESVKGYKEDGIRGAVREGVNALDPSSLVMPEGKGLVERLFDRFAGSAKRDAASVSSDRKAAGRQAAAREHTLELTPLAQTPPAVTPNKQAPHQAAESVAHINHGWTDAARAASQRVRGVNVTIQGK
ncbi:Peptidoglycan-binding domain 1 protein [Hyphomicrobium denitrificans ATCC 51888]|uniref:Peptidoglycan-binding domain 1 protein n=1 Tax=Hyphomicrobium denitrificans (strain ATCC 51888 / DSM 1869 / NCIMB 11706 / TK 0415) TaxID=582899 RepID=D8JWB1_HYPDA|nr:peptidoglycan-binding domain-containing protein [Hyphomicrobium denitrificans]ADJ23024.1 Peptidoglycan-binding domain 1 protein [Hyphomicrobium denitrificans ATCC 51888]